MSEVTPATLGVTIYGLSAEEVEDTLRTYDISHDRAKHPGLCSRKSKRPEGYHDAGDNLDLIMCYYCYGPCWMPHRTHDSGSSDCAGDDDAGALILALIVIMILIAVIIVAAPFIIAAIGFLVDIIIAGAVTLFDFLTFGVFRKYLRRTRFHLYSPDESSLRNAYDEMVAKGGLPRAPEYWTNWFIGVRLGAVLTIGGLLTAATILLLGGGGALWAIPIGIIFLAILLLGFGTRSIRHKRHGILQKLGPSPKDLPV